MSLEDEALQQLSEMTPVERAQVRCHMLSADWLSYMNHGRPSSVSPATSERMRGAILTALAQIDLQELERREREAFSGNSLAMAKKLIARARR